MTESLIMKEYLDNAIFNLRKLAKAATEREEKLQIELRINIFQELKDRFNLIKSSEEERQSERISSLATMRKIDALPIFVTKQEWAIRIYGLILLTLPYMHALNRSNNGLLDLSIKFCDEILDNIRKSGNNYRGVIPSVKEIEESFHYYFKINNQKTDMYKECYEKIEELYQTLMENTSALNSDLNSK